MSQLRYTNDHEWVRIEGDVAVVGISDYAQEQLGDIVYIDLPEVGMVLKQAQKLGEVESVKSVSDLYSPVSGEVVEVNQEVLGHPELVNEDPSGRGWLIRTRPSDPTEMDQLMTAAEYEALFASLGQ